jgi:hypothetical protein
MDMRAGYFGEKLGVNRRTDAMAVFGPGIISIPEMENVPGFSPEEGKKMRW